MAEINLLPVEDRSAENLTDLQKKATFVSFAVLILTAAATIATLVMFTIYAGERNKLNDKINETSGKIESSKNVEELLVVVGKKATSAEKLLSVRMDHTNFFDKLSTLVPQGVYFTDMKIIGTKISMSIKARTSSDVAGLVSSLVSDNGSIVVSGVSMGSLSSDARGVYTFSMDAEIVTVAGCVISPQTINVDQNLNVITNNFPRKTLNVKMVGTDSHNTIILGTLQQPKDRGYFYIQPTGTASQSYQVVVNSGGADTTCIGMLQVNSASDIQTGATQ